MENATTKGHSAAQGGLRGHSMGDAYPEIVIGLGEGFAKYNVLTGETGPVRKTYNEALFWKELDQPCPVACPRAQRQVACATCDWFTLENRGVAMGLAAAYRPDELRLRLLTGAHGDCAAERAASW